ncbi:MAG: LTA synthase family protein [Bacilli bacterium]|nr:LTA synthase family protein [Bacilli bacterium]
MMKSFFKKVKKSMVNYFMTNKLFVSYVVLAFIGTIIARFFSFGHTIFLKAQVTDLAMILLIGLFGYLFKPKNRFRYYLTWLIIFTLIETINVIYYKFFTSFASFSEIATLGQTETVAGSIFEKLHIINFVYVLSPVIFYLTHLRISKTNYYTFIEKINNTKKCVLGVLIAAFICLAYSFGTATRTDYSRIAKQWNRVYIADRFGFILYQFNDLVQTLTPKFSSLFGYEDAARAFENYFINERETKYNTKNEYTNIFKGKNVIFVHMESIQTFLMDYKFNGEEVLPTVNKLASEGMFFENFYPQISTGTSSDTEFTLLTSLMPAASGTVFVSYYNRTYNTIPKYLKDLGYTTFSMHGNHASMWNRSKVHPKLGYQKMYFEESFKYTDDDVINLGINDSLFFEQAMPILENIENENSPYMGTIITLSNHSPFTYTDKYLPYDLSYTYTNSKGNKVTTNYLSGTAAGNYITSAHSADVALGEFIDYINESDLFNDTIFVFYGDHESRLSKSEMNYLINYNPETGNLYDKNDQRYKAYDNFDHELSKKTPLIIWSKNKNIRESINKKVSYTMGMYDVMPTIGNMFGFSNPFAMGHDIFSIKNNNTVVFPNGNFVTNKVYYNNVKGKYKALKPGIVLDENYIKERTDEAERILDVSNGIIVHNLIKKDGSNVLNRIESGN